MIGLDSVAGACVQHGGQGTEWRLADCARSGAEGGWGGTAALWTDLGCRCTTTHPAAVGVRPEECNDTQFKRAENDEMKQLLPTPTYRY